MKGDFEMLNSCMWNIFKKTGNIEAYLYLSELDRLNNKDKHLIETNRIEKIAVNDQVR